MLTYSIVTPVKNEEKFIGRCMANVRFQTVQPKEWIIVNDECEDATVDIIAADMRPKAKCFRLLIYDGKQGDGTGIHYRDVVQWGIDRLQDVDLIAILDADIILPYNYYERMIRIFTNIQSLAICGGTIKNERRPWYLPPMANRVFRREALEQIGGIPRYHNHDTMSALMVRHKVWLTYALESAQCTHLRSLKQRKPLDQGRSYRQSGMPWFEAIIKAVKLKSPQFIRGYLSATCWNDDELLKLFMKRFLWQQHLIKAKDVYRDIKFK